jgi:hypothetical protein
VWTTTARRWTVVDIDAIRAKVDASGAGRRVRNGDVLALCDEVEGLRRQVADLRAEREPVLAALVVADAPGDSASATMGERVWVVVHALESLRRQVEEMRECGLSIHKRVAQERAAIVAYLRGAVDRPAQHVADDIEEGFHHE